MESKINITKEHSVFISYSWDSEEHIEWIIKFADMIRKSGVQVVIDQTDFILGDPLPRIMEDAIMKCEYVLFVCTPKYKKKADEHIGGVSYEDTIITGEIYEKQNHRKYIPIFIDNDVLKSLPNWAKGKLGVVFDNRKLTRKNSEKLIRTLGGNIDSMELHLFFSKESNEKEMYVPSFYSMTPYMQLILLSNIKAMLDQIVIDDFDKYPSALENTLFLLDSIEPERLTSEVQTKLNNTIKDIDEYYNELIHWDMQDNPD